MTDNKKLDLILEKLNNVEEDVTGMKKQIAGIEEEITGMKAEMADMNSWLSVVENDVKDVKLTIENEIRVNIQRVAEGHLDLSRILHDAMKPNNELEMLSIRVGILETDVKGLKPQMA